MSSMTLCLRLKFCVLVVAPQRLVIQGFQADEEEHALRARQLAQEIAVVQRVLGDERAPALTRGCAASISTTASMCARSSEKLLSWKLIIGNQRRKLVSGAEAMALSISRLSVATS